jgi:hypothetical protein
MSAGEVRENLLKIADDLFRATSGMDALENAVESAFSGVQMWTQGTGNHLIPEVLQILVNMKEAIATIEEGVEEVRYRIDQYIADAL